MGQILSLIISYSYGIPISRTPGSSNQKSFPFISHTHFYPQFLVLFYFLNQSSFPLEVETIVIPL